MRYSGSGHSSVLSHRCHSFLLDTHGLWIIAEPSAFFSHPDISLSLSPPNKNGWTGNVGAQRCQGIYPKPSTWAPFLLHDTFIPVRCPDLSSKPQLWLTGWWAERTGKRLSSQHRNGASAWEHFVAGNQRKMRFRRERLRGAGEPWGGACCLEYKTRHWVVRKMVSIKRSYVHWHCRRKWKWTVVLFSKDRQAWAQTQSLLCNEMPWMENNQRRWKKVDSSIMYILMSILLLFLY